ADTFTRGEMSPAHREALEAVLDGHERRFLAGIAAGRKLDPERARALVDGGPWLIADARGAGLLDGVRYRDELPAHLQARATGGPGAAGEPRVVPWHRWLAGRPRWYLPPLRRRRAIAVLSLEGAIVPGEGGDPLQKSCGADSAARALATLRDDRRF